MAQKILIIDDDKIFLKILKDHLLSEEEDVFTVVTASDGEDGLKKAEEEKPDLIVSDLLMPKVDGLALIKALKSKSDLADIPIIVSTQSPDMNKISEVTELGAKGYIIKSDYNIDSIVKKIKDVLEKKA